MSDEAVRKELTAVMVERIIRLRFKKHGDDARLDNILAQYRSAAIQECADFISKFGRDKIDPAVAAKKLLCETLPNAVLALKER